MSHIFYNFFYFLTDLYSPKANKYLDAYNV